MSPPANDNSSEPVALKINSPMGTFKNIPESSFSSVNSELTAAGKRDNDVRAVAREATWAQFPNPGWMPKSKRAAVHLQHVRAVARQIVGKRVLPKRLDTSTSSFDQDAGSRETSAVSVPFGWVALGVVAARQLVVRTSETTCLIKEREAARNLPQSRLSGRHK